MLSPQLLELLHDWWRIARQFTAPDRSSFLLVFDPQGQPLFICSARAGTRNRSPSSHVTSHNRSHWFARSGGGHHRARQAATHSATPAEGWPISSCCRSQHRHSIDRTRNNFNRGTRPSPRRHPPDLWRRRMCPRIRYRRRADRNATCQVVVVCAATSVPAKYPTWTAASANTESPIMPVAEPNCRSRLFRPAQPTFWLDRWL
jgi:hypothetical protein